MSTRIVLYIKDHRAITGKSARQAARDFKKIKERFGIENVNYISLSYYLKFTGLSPEDVEKRLKERN